MATLELINKALATMNNHDWYWCFADYTHPAIDNARGNMRYFVELVATITDANYENVHANLWSKNEESNKVYEAKKAELMAIILPSESGQMMAA